jgi:UDP-N-acetylmuramate--alanine ligase
MKFNDIHTVYFIGIGGIGMSAIARFFKSQGKQVLGYDKTETNLTKALQSEDIKIHFEDLGDSILSGLDKEKTLVIYTPAIPVNHGEYNALKDADFNIIKRAKALGVISEEKETYAVAGTHGKTTTSSILAHVLYETDQSCNAFIGGITTNYQSNCLIDENSNKVVVEADEFDRSFLQLSPDYSIITSMDADHLDIYGKADELERSFIEFVERTSKEGIVLAQADLDFKSYRGKSQLLTYGFNNSADWKGDNLRYVNGQLFFDISNGDKLYKDVQLGLPGKHNAENALAVFGLLSEVGITEKSLRSSFKSYKGVKRRFEYHIRRDDMIVIDDYAHHPKEIIAFLSSVKELYPTKKITVVFQPHLFSRTNDFMLEFADALALADKLFLLDIYPARELPIAGVTSQVLFDIIKMDHKKMSSKEIIVVDLKKDKHEVIVIVGAGDIDTCINQIVCAYE